MNSPLFSPCLHLIFAFVQVVGWVPGFLVPVLPAAFPSNYQTGKSSWHLILFTSVLKSSNFSFTQNEFLVKILKNLSRKHPKGYILASVIQTNDIFSGIWRWKFLWGNILITKKVRNNESNLTHHKITLEWNQEKISRQRGRPLHQDSFRRDVSLLFVFISLALVPNRMLLKNLVPRNECAHAFLEGLLFYVFNWISPHLSP